MPFILESTNFIEMRVLEECMQLEKFDQDFIDNAVDAWCDIIGVDMNKDWHTILISQLKKVIFNRLREGRYFYAAL